MVDLGGDLPSFVVCKPLMSRPVVDAVLPRRARLSLALQTRARVDVLGVLTVSFAIASRRLLGEEVARVDDSVRPVELKGRRMRLVSVGWRDDADARVLRVSNLWSESAPAATLSSKLKRTSLLFISKTHSSKSTV